MNKAFLSVLTALVAIASVAASDGDFRVLDAVVQQDVKVGGFWRGEYRKLAVKWLPHCIRQMEKSS